MNTGTDTRVLMNARGICRAMQGIRFTPWISLFTEQSFWREIFPRGEGRQTALRESTTEIWFPRRRDIRKKNDLASFRRIMRHPIRLIYCQGQGEERRPVRSRRQEEGSPEDSGGRGGQRGVMRQKAGNEAANKKGGEKDNRRQTATSGRLHEPEAAVYSIWQARYSSANSPRFSLPFADDRRRMKYALAWISNGAANRIRLAMNLPTRWKRRRRQERTKPVKFWGGDDGCVCTFERQGWFKRLATNGD